MPEINQGTSFLLCTGNERSMKRPEQMLLNYLKENNIMIAFAESMTCGLAASRIGSVAGTSEAFAGSIICYSEAVKKNLLKVPKKLIDKYTAESQQVTNVLAKNLSKKISADVYAAVTGLSSPGASETKQKPVGTVFISVLYRRKISGLKKKYNGSPLQIRQKACDDLFKLCLKELKKHRASVKKR